MSAIRESAEAKAEILADEICACANREQHRRDVKLITNALLAARVEEREACAQLIENWHVLRDGDMTRAKLAKAILARALELELELEQAAERITP